MGTGVKLLTTAVLAVSTLCHAQSQTINPANVDRKVLAKSEDSLADQFVSIRKAAGLRQLTRIKNRSQLRQMVCTAAVNGKSKQWGSGGPAFYETTDLTKLAPQVEQMAKFELQKLATPMPTIQRFAVAVWPSKIPNAYWVGVGLYDSAALEWISLHLTDEYYYGNLWKKDIAPECKSVR
jgi:hypothetical protein